MRSIAFALIFLAAAASVARADVIAGGPDAVTTETLIDTLTQIGEDAPGFAALGLYDSFIAVDEPPRFTMGVLGAPSPKTPPSMRALARRGVAALPALLAHLGDARPTQLTVGRRDIFTTGDAGNASDFPFMWREFGTEYDPRVRPTAREDCLKDCARSFQGPYIVKVADVCLVLIGQIVGRNLNAVRYQPTAGLIVNSPIETPILAERARKDWQGLDQKAHAASLIADIEASPEVWHFGPAMTRLRFYYPETYAALNGANAKKRATFEAEEEEARKAQVGQGRK